MLNHISDEQLRDMYFVRGMSGKEIAKVIGCTPAAVCMRMKESGMKARKPHDYPPTEKQIAAWRENGRRLSTLPQTRAAMRRNGKANKGRRRTNCEFGGHEKKRNDGYICCYVPDHPAATHDGYVMKHRLIMERKINRYLTEDEVVHHINHVRDDNRIENLQLMTKHDHMSLHMRERHEKRRKTCSTILSAQAD